MTSGAPGPRPTAPSPEPRTPGPGSRVLLAHYQEITLKGQNRTWFIRHLARQVRDALAGLDVGDVRLPMGRLEVPFGDGVDTAEVERRIQRVFGLANYALATRVAPDVDAITAGVLRDLPRDRAVPSFRVEVRRAHKQFPVPSPDLERHIGAKIHDLTNWRVDLSNPAFTIWVEIAPKDAYYYYDKLPAAGGLPSGTGGRVLVLLSGGIDSPVAAWRISLSASHTRGPAPSACYPRELALFILRGCAHRSPSPGSPPCPSQPRAPTMRRRSRRPRRRARNRPAAAAAAAAAVWRPAPGAAPRWQTAAAQAR